MNVCSELANLTVGVNACTHAYRTSMKLLSTTVIYYSDMVTSRNRQIYLYAFI